MAKRFTDTQKWRNEWFRTLPPKAKLAWIYLCDECEFFGVIKIDYGLASFQLGFDISKQILDQWFAEKIHFISDENILITQFFEFQYGESKDSWSAKIKAKEKLENLGFVIENNKIINIPLYQDTTVVPQCSDSDTTVLSKGIVKGIINNNKKKEEKIKFDQFMPIQEIKNKWQQVYTREYLTHQESLMELWILNNPEENYKTPRGWTQFMSNWFARGWAKWQEQHKPKVNINGFSPNL